MLKRRSLPVGEPRFWGEVRLMDPSQMRLRGGQKQLSSDHISSALGYTFSHNLIPLKWGCVLQSMACHTLIGSIFSLLVVHQIKWCILYNWGHLWVNENMVPGTLSQSLSLSGSFTLGEMITYPLNYWIIVYWASIMCQILGSRTRGCFLSVSSTPGTLVALFVPSGDPTEQRLLFPLFFSDRGGHRRLSDLL